MAIRREKLDLTDEELKKRNKKVFWISFAIAFVISAGVAVGCYFLARERLDSLYGILLDTFSIPMVMFFLVWCFTKISDYGAMDAIVYSVKLAFTAIFHPNIRKSKLPATYREYREMKQGKERIKSSFLLWGCLPYLIVSIVFLVLYLVNKK